MRRGVRGRKRLRERDSKYAPVFFNCNPRGLPVVCGRPQFRPVTAAMIYSGRLLCFFRGLFTPFLCMPKSWMRQSCASLGLMTSSAYPYSTCRIWLGHGEPVAGLFREPLLRDFWVAGLLLPVAVGGPDGASGSRVARGEVSSDRDGEVGSAPGFVDAPPAASHYNLESSSRSGPQPGSAFEASRWLLGRLLPASPRLRSPLLSGLCPGISPRSGVLVGLQMPRGPSREERAGSLPH